VTITVGFICHDGIVLGADSQESYEGSALKRSVPKLVAFPPIDENDNEVHDRRVIFTGAGDSALVDKLINEAWLEAAVSNPNIVEIATAIEKRIVDLYSEYNNVFPPGYMPSAQLTYGIWCGGETRLYYAQGPVINEIGRQTGLGYKALGMGNEITDYIRERILAKPKTLADAIVMTSYMLGQAIAHGQGCGGEIRISVLWNDGRAENVKVDNFATEILKELDNYVSFALLRAANPKTNDQVFSIIWDAVHKRIIKLREARSEAAKTERENKEELERAIKEMEESLRRKEAELRDESIEGVNRTV
jgi:hypothetical protein